jgi:hypothetical protein
MPLQRPFDQADRNVLDMLNDLMSVGMPRPTDVNGVPYNIGANVQLLAGEHFGCVLDCTAAVTITANADTLFDGFNCTIYALSGTVTLTMPFIDNTASKTITVGNAAVISCNGTKYRIARMAAT